MTDGNDRYSITIHQLCLKTVYQVGITVVNKDYRAGSQSNLGIEYSRIPDKLWQIM